MSGVAFIEGCPLYRIVLTSELAFIQGCPHVRGGLYTLCQGRGVLYIGSSSRQGWPL